MRNFIFIFFSLLVSTTLAQTNHSVNDETNHITVFVAKKIITMDPGWPTATAVAVQKGRVLSVGSLEDLQPWLKRFPHTIDRQFENKILMPGFVEAHGHPLIGGTAITRPLLTYLPIPNPYGPGFPGVKTKAQALAKLRDYLNASSNDNEPLITWGYDIIAMGGELLNKNELDQISKDKPIIVWDASEHFVFTNSAALKKFNVTKDSTKIHGVMADADGEPNGQFLGVTAAESILPKALLPLLTPEAATKNIRFLMDLSHQNGITTTSELAFGMVDLPLELKLYQGYFNRPETSLRLVVVTDAESMQRLKGEDAINFAKSLTLQNTDTLMFNGIKFFADDAFVSLGMVIENPGYIDGRKGFFITPPDKMFEAWLPWWQAGFHIHVHSNGNGGNQATINALAALLNAAPRFDHRFTIEHYGISTEEMAKKIKQLGGVVSVNPFYLYARSEFNAPYLGTDRAFLAARLRTLVDAGITTSLHTDTPVAIPNPLEEVWIAVNRFGLSGQVHGEAERVSVHDALKMITINAAYTLGIEDKVGSISPGKFADFSVLDEDPYQVAKENIKDIPLWGTVIGGRPVPKDVYT